MPQDQEPSGPWAPSPEQPPPPYYYQPPDQSYRKGFNTTMGVLAALFVVFVLLPIAGCVGCAACASVAPDESRVPVQYVYGGR